MKEAAVVEIPAQWTQNPAHLHPVHASQGYLSFELQKKKENWYAFEILRECMARENCIAVAGAQYHILSLDVHDDIAVVTMQPKDLAPAKFG